MHRVAVGTRDLVKGAEDVGNFELIGRRAGPPDRPIADGMLIGAGDGLQGLGMGLQDLAGADEADFERVSHGVIRICEQEGRTSRLRGRRVGGSATVAHRRMYGLMTAAGLCIR